MGIRPSRSGRTALGLCALVVLFAAASSAVQAVSFRPDAQRALAMLSGEAAADLGASPGSPAEPAAESVRAEVDARGFYAGAAPGTAACERCHADIVAQYSASAHRFASFNNPFYSAAVLSFRDERGPEASRFCADCHDPLLVADGTLERPGPFDPTTVAAQSGVTCLVCHSIAEPPDLRGNGGFIVDARPLSLKPGTAHDARFRTSLMSESRFCAGCHKVGLTETVTADAWLRGQNEYDAWYDSAWSGRGVAAVYRPPAPKTCQGCHMPLEPAVLGDKAAKDGQIRSHRFLGANTALPALRGDADHLARTREFLRGAVTLSLATSRAGTLDVVMRNRRAGHLFPGGTADSNQAWLEVVARDAHGGVVGESGQVDEKGAISEEAHVLRGQPVDADGRPLRRRDVQHARGSVFDTSLPPGDPRIVQFALPRGTHTVEVRLRYRKFSTDFGDFACSGLPDARLRTLCADLPTTLVAETSAPVNEGAVPPLVDADERLAHALALGQGLADRAAGRDAVQQTLDALSESDDPKIQAWAALGRARLDLAAGRWGGPPLGDDAAVAALWSRAVAAHRAHRDAEALPVAERLLARLPDDRAVLGLVARLQNIVGRPTEAQQTARRLLAVDPENEEALLQRLLALRTLGRPAAEVEPAEREWLRHRRPIDRELQLRRASRISLREAVTIHVHPLLPPRDRKQEMRRDPPIRRPGNGR